MKIERDGADAFVVYANADELTLLNNALNENLQWPRFA
jgi:hypothetical protein